jgi:monoamine oxidase
MYEKFNKLLEGERCQVTGFVSWVGRKREKGMTCDTLFEEVVYKVKEEFKGVYKNNPNNITAAYEAITKKYDKFTLRSYLTKVANWTDAAINLHDVGNAHVVFDNGFIESWKDAFLSSNSQSGKAGMKQGWTEYQIDLYDIRLSINIP